MPIDREGRIYVEKKQKKFFLRRNLKNVCLIVTTCISIMTAGIAIHSENINNMRYEKELSQLNLEKEKYKNILKENKIQIRNSYIMCHVNYIQTLFDKLGDNVKILSNDLTKIFYNKKHKKYLTAKDIEKKYTELTKKYNQVYPEVLFLKIEIIGNRQIDNVTINFDKIEKENYIKEHFKNFSDLKNKKTKKSTIFLGDMEPNDIILVPVVLQYSEGDFVVQTQEDDMQEYLLYKNIYIPRNITFYDIFYEKNITLRIRDALEDSLITNFYFEELG